MKKILLITTGGTIACVSSEKGLKPGQDGKQVLSGVKDELNIRNLNCDIDIYDLFSLDSSNVGPDEWTQIINTLYKKMDGYDGIVILHGTDTMAYTAAAVSITMDELCKPIVITGSQLPMGEKGSDAEGNLKDAITVALAGKAGVFICFAGRIICGDSAKKTHSKNFQAFESIGKDYAGFINDGNITWNDKDDSEKVVNITHKPDQIKFDPKVACIKLLPGADADMVDALINLGYRGIILEAFGSGNVPNIKGDLFSSIKKAIAKGIRVAIVSQCTYDGTDLSIYEMGKQALELQVIDAKKMTVEALSVKMMYEIGTSNI